MLSVIINSRFTHRVVLQISVLLLILLVGVTACNKPDLDDIIKARIDALVAAIEREKTRTMLEFFSDSVQVQQQLVKRDVGALALRYFYTRDNIKIYISLLDIEPESPELPEDKINIVHIRAKVLLTSGKQTLPQRLGLYEVTGYWQKTEGDWLIQKLNWRRLPEVNR